MFDLPYILTHPLLRSIMVRRTELKEQADSLPRGSAKRKALEKRIWHQEQYRLPKEDGRDAGQRDKERMFLRKAARRSVNVTARVSGRAGNEGADPKNSRSNPVQHTKKNWLIRKALAGDCGAIRNHGRFGIALRGTALERSAEK